MTNRRELDDFWPIGVSDITGEELRLLDDVGFSVLKRRILEREYRLTGSRGHAKATARQLEIKRRTEKRTEFSKRALLSVFRKSEFLESFVPDRDKRWRSFSRRKKGVVINASEFSFLDNPLKTFETLKKIAIAECEAIGFKTNFDDEYVLDIGPFLVLGVMRQDMAPVAGGGLISGATQKVIEAVGLREFLRIRSFGRTGIEEVFPFPLRQRRRAGTTKSKTIASQPTTVEVVADQTAKHVDHWLSKLDPPTALTPFGAGRIKGFVGEILNNAERHSRPSGDGDWMAAGYMTQRPVEVDGDEHLVHICHLSFYNPGRPISESIKDAPQETLSQIGRYMDAHPKCGICSETLATVFALQDGISRLVQGDGRPSGGTGIMDIVEFANAVGRSDVDFLKPKVAMVSGRAYVRFDGEYAQGRSEAGESRRLQWFNKENSALHPPDLANVHDLPQSFPGTLITTRFVIDGSLQKALKDD